MRRVWIALLVTAAGLVAPAGSHAGPLRAGAAASDLTPPVGTPMFAYTARSLVAGPDNLPGVALNVLADPPTGLYAKTFVPSRGIHTRVRARAVVLESDAGKFALVQADLGGVPLLLTQQVAERVAPLGIRAERILLSATHTHSSTGPIWPTDSTGYGALGGDIFDARIFALTRDAIVEAIVAANARLAPARAGVGSAQVTTASRNRGFDAFERNADVPDAEEAARAASIDPLLTVLRVETAAGRPLAAWSNFAIHPTSFGDENLLFSGDNAGYAERVAEQRIGRGVINVWTNSNEGDISPNGDPDVEESELGTPEEDGEERQRNALQYAPNEFGQAHLAGLRVGKGIAAAWRDAGGRMSRQLRLDARRTFVDFDGTAAEGEPVGPLSVLGFGGIVGPDGFCAPVDNFAGPGQGRKFPALAGSGLVPRIAPVSLFRIGRLGIAAYPSEITRQMGARIRGAIARASGGTLDGVVLAGLSNSYVSYTSTPEEYDACQYEGSFTLYGRRQGPRYREVGAALSMALAAGAPAPPGAAEPSPAPPPSTGGVTPRETPQAGQPTDQPKAAVKRFERAVFAWRGGDPQVDAPRTQTFVKLQRQSRKRRSARQAQARWQTVATDDSFADTVERSEGDVWTERFQFTECDPLGTYRFVVTGVADRGSGAAPYSLTSRPFTLQPVELTVRAPTVSGRTARVVAEYADPGEDILLALPRRVRAGSAVLEVRGPRGRVRQVLARPDEKGLAFTARVPAGATVRVLGVHDRCGNGFGPTRAAPQRRGPRKPAGPRFTG